MQGAKKVRLLDGSATATAVPAASEHGAVPVLHAASSIFLHVPGCPPYQPAFAHQPFPKEKLKGYSKARIDISYDTLFHMRVRFHYFDKHPEAQDVLSCLKAVLPKDFDAAACYSEESCSEIQDSGFGSSLSAVGEAPNWQPLGEELYSYTQKGRHFSIFSWKLETADLKHLHNRMSTLAPWGIETASPIDVEDDKWTVYGLYEKKSADAGAAAGSASGGAAASPSAVPGWQYAGFMTVYSFTNPLKKRRPKTLRLAQLLLLPPFQRQGHGRHFLQCLQSCIAERRGKVAMSSDGEIVEHAAAGAAGAAAGEAAAAEDEESQESVSQITVEAPCDGMSRLRDFFDCSRCIDRDLFGHLQARKDAARADGEEGAAGGAAAAAVSSALPWLPPSHIRQPTDAELNKLIHELRVTKAQAYRCYEVSLLAHLGPDAILAASASAAGSTAGGSAAAGGEELLRQYRLLVKRRIYTNDEEIQAVKDDTARKTALEAEWQDCFSQYAQTLLSLGKLQTAEGVAGAKQLVQAYKQRMQEEERERLLQEEEEDKAESFLAPG